MKNLRPLLILAALIAWKVWQDQQTGAVLGTRTMGAIDEFKAKLEPIAKSVQNDTGYSARLGILQASLESRYGNSDLSRPSAQLAIMKNGKQIGTGPALNLFGFKTGEAWIKAGKPYVLIATTDYYSIGDRMPNGEIATRNNQPLKWPASFRAYASWQESYQDWARLMGIEVYQKDGATAALRKDDLVNFGKALSIHYAPNQDYDQRLAQRAREMGMTA